MPEQPGDHQGYRQRRPSPSHGGDGAPYGGQYGDQYGEPYGDHYADPQADRYASSYADYADPASDPYGERPYYRQEPRQESRQQPPDQAAHERRAAGAAGPPRRRPPGRPISSTLGLTLLGTVVPGFGLIVAGRRRLGSAILVVFVILAAFLAWFGLFDRRDLMHAAVDPDTLALLGAVLFGLGLVWVGVIVATHRSLRSRMATPLDRILGSAVVAVLSIVVLSPLAIGSRYAFVSRDVVLGVFDDDDSRSATRPDVTEENPWAGKDRVNILLLGGDAGKGRTGTRTDTVMVASIDTKTGNTVLFSLPRNLEKIPFPSDSALADAYPDGIYHTPGGDEGEQMLNSMYQNVPRDHPDAIGETDHPGADVLKLAVGESLGLKLDYYVLINLKGFQQLVDALGGITVNINTRVAIGGDTDRGIEPHDWLEPGPNQHLDGYNALWYARGRYGASDYQRMKRQRCAMKAIIDKAKPAEVLRRYEQIAKTSTDIVETDIPGKLLPAFVDLSMNVKDAKVTSIAFTNELIEHYDPDYDFIREKVSKAVAASVAPGTEKAADKTAAPTPTDDSGDTSDTGDENNSDGSSDDGTSASPAPTQPADSLDDSCAYRPEGQD
jgi:LCP family protein required for cell wall assembly